MISKPQIPLWLPEIIARPRLTALLEQDVQRYPLLLVSAPPGYGKTTLLAEWARASQFPVAWLPLTEEEDDAMRFLRRLLQAWEKVQPGVVETPFGILLRALMPDMQAVLTALIEVAGQIDEHLVIVIDDYHLVVDDGIHTAMAYLLDHMPGRLHFILTARGMPALPLARYRARRQLLELGPGDLHFTRSESAAFLTQLSGLELASETVDTVHDETEGWAAGLQLAALALRQQPLRPQGGKSQQAVSGRQRFIADYLKEDVLAGLPEDVRRFLLRTSLLERLCASLCEAVTGERGGQEMLDHLERENLFLVPLDDQRAWFRYHTLFGDFLRGELARSFPEETARLHCRAARWYFDHDLPEPAFTHAQAAEDVALVSDILKRHAIAKLMAGEFKLVKRWLEALHPDWYDQYPEFGLYQAMYLFNTGAFQAAARRVDQVEQELQAAEHAQAREQIAGVTVMRCFMACLNNDLSRAQTLANQALESLSGSETVGYRPGVYVALGDTYRANGRWEEARACYLKALDFVDLPAVQVSSVHLYGALADLAIRQGQLKQAAAYWRKALDVIQNQAAWGWYSLPVIGWVYIRMGEVLYEWNELAEAGQHLERGMERANLGGDVQTQIAGNLLDGRLKLSQGDLPSTAARLEQVELLLERAPFPIWTPRFERLRLELWLAQGHIHTAARWAAALLEDEQIERRAENEMTRLAAARALIAGGDASALRQARGLLVRLLESTRAQGRAGLSIEALALMALCQWQMRDPAGAMTSLEASLRMAEPEGYRRLYLDLGLPMARLFQEARARAVLPEIVAGLLADFQTAPTSPTLEPERLPEPLTAREQEILQYLAAGLTNSEIAQKLVISPETVKKHLAHLYGKLGAASRTQAVARARALELLE